MNEIYPCFQMNPTESLSEDDLTLCPNDTTKSAKSMNAYRKLHSSNSLNSDTLNSFNTELYYSDLNNNNKSNHCSSSSSSGHSIHHKNDFMKYSNDIVDSSKLNPILAIASHQWFDRLFHSNSYTSNHSHHPRHHHQHHHHPHGHHQRSLYNPPHHQHRHQQENQQHNQQTCLGGMTFESSHEYFGRIRLNSNFVGYSQSDENNPLTHSIVNSNLELSRFNDVQNDSSIDDNINGNNNDETNENDDITTNNNINVTNATKYDYSSSHGKGTITSPTPKTHSSDYPTEFSFNTGKFTNYSNYFTEFNKNEITERQDKQPTLPSTHNNDNNNNSSGFDDRDHEPIQNTNDTVYPNRLRSKLMSEINEPAKKLCYSFNSECNPTDIRDNQSVKNTGITDKSYLGSFQNTKVDESCMNSITMTSSGNFSNQPSKSPVNDSSLSSPGQTNSQRTLNTEGTTTTSLLEWHLTSENNFIAKIKSDHSNEHLEPNSNGMFTNVSMNNPFKNNDNTTNNSKDCGVYEEKLSTSTDRHSPPLSYSSQSTENLNDESVRGGNSQHASYLHPAPAPPAPPAAPQNHPHQHTDKLCSDVNNEFLWKANPPPGGDLMNYENEISYIKNRWNTNHHFLMNKLRFGGNLSTTNSAVFTSSNNNNEMNYPEQNLTDIAGTSSSSNRSHIAGFDSMIPCISHNFLTNFTRTSYDGGQNNCLQENLYDLSSSSGHHHLNSHSGGFTNPTNFFNLDSGSSSSNSTTSGSHPVSTSSSSDHNRLDDVYDRTEQCLGLNSLSQHHNHHHNHHHQFMMMNNCANDYSMNLSNDVTMATGSVNDFKTGLNYYLLPPVNGFTANTDASPCQITNGGITSNNFKNRLTASAGGYSSQNFTHSNLLNCSHSNTSIYRHPVELDYNPRELEAFSELFKQRRIKLGVTQADVGKALGNLKISGVGSLSQSTICRFESLTLSHNNMIALKPVLQAWLEEAEAEASSRSNHPSIYDLEEERRRKRTSITDSEKRSLEAFFSIQPRPSSEKISQIAEKLNLKKNVVRVWFCNQRQKQKRMKFSTLGMLHHSATRT
ncbi:unnamed protein product [Trichobilharzia szidati]|nr:unnamed protein product [Trichobilharzia szidati]